VDRYCNALWNRGQHEFLWFAKDLGRIFIQPIAFDFYPFTPMITLLSSYEPMRHQTVYKA
jgi:hypothetical protein